MTRPLTLTFLPIATPVPVGGVAVQYELAIALAARGHHVRLFHLPYGGFAPASLADIGWFDLPDELEHHFGGRPINQVPDADVIFGHSADIDANPRVGLPVALVQGFQMAAEPVERATFQAPCPKVCVARWLVDVARTHYGVPAEQLVHIPPGLHQERFPLTAPIEGRPPQVAFCYGLHPNKGADIAIRTLRLVRQRTHGIHMVAFGASEPPHQLPPWLQYHLDPPAGVLLDDVYNASTVFLQASRVEGFGLPCIEAMACGAALVTTDCGGSQDYAVDGDTALVRPIEDPEALADAIVALLGDEARRVALATAGNALARSFTWERAAASLEAFLFRYLDDPTSFGRAPAG